MKRKSSKILLTILILVIIVIVTFMIYANVIIRASLPITNGEILAKKINKEVKISFDKMGIPQVWAETEKDAWYAVGWLHANDRLFQMELTRRVSQGRLSEMFGDITLEFDHSQRRIGHLRMAKSDIKNLGEDKRSFLQAYVDGVNQWAKTVDYLPFEFILLGLDYEEWKIEDCMSILSFQTWFSDALQNNDEVFSYAYEKYGPERTKELFLEFPDWSYTTVPQIKEITKLDKKSIENSNNLNLFQKSLLKNILASDLLLPSMTYASNCWVVSPERSESGQTILASDPHLDITRLPQFWYLIGVHVKETNLNVFGITSPGLPIFVMGHNGNTAWAFTAGGIDVTDQFHEKINPENKNQFLFKESWQDFSIVEELIYSSESDVPETLLLKTNHHGPVIYENDSLNFALTLKWAGFDQSLATAVDAGFDLPKIKSFAEFRNKVTRFGALDANWIYADKNGNIGYQLGTPIPIREKYNYNMPIPGWLVENKWSGYVPLDKTPFSYNPSQGWLATSNNKPDQKNLDYKLHGNFAYDRILRINELMQSKDKFNTSDFENFQLDLTANYLLRWKSEAIQILKNLNETTLADKLEEWKGFTGIKSIETALLQSWMFYFREFTFSDELEKKYRGLKFNLLEKENLPENSLWFDDISTKDTIESRNDIAMYAMKKALEKLREKKWGEIQFVTMGHPLSQVPVLSNLLNLKRGPFSRGGTAGTLNASFNTMNKENFKVIVGPSWRFIIDFSDIDNVRTVIPAGQSGHPLSSHFFDFYPLWVNGKNWIVNFSEKTIQKNTISTVKLKPYE